MSISVHGPAGIRITAVAMYKNLDLLTSGLNKDQTFRLHLRAVRPHSHGLGIAAAADRFQEVRE
jgi:hypothetical protein